MKKTSKKDFAFMLRLSINDARHAIAEFSNGKDEIQHLMNARELLLEAVNEIENYLIYN